jgi:hypothetical protein
LWLTGSKFIALLQVDVGRLGGTTNTIDRAKFTTTVVHQRELERIKPDHPHQNGRRERLRSLAPYFFYRSNAA